MDTKINRQTAPMERDGVDPVVLRQAILAQTVRKARFGAAAMACLMLGLGAISLTAPQGHPVLHAGFGEGTAMADAPMQPVRLAQGESAR